MGDVLLKSFVNSTEKIKEKGGFQIWEHFLTCQSHKRYEFSCKLFVLHWGHDDHNKINHDHNKTDLENLNILFLST